jgi:hypothetical protein
MDAAQMACFAGIPDNFNPNNWPVRIGAVDLPQFERKLRFNGKAYYKSRQFAGEWRTFRKGTIHESSIKPPGEPDAGFVRRDGSGQSRLGLGRHL